MARRGDVDEAERELRKSFDREHLAVYADALLGIGDLRGELCAIDLTLSDREPDPDKLELIARRAEIVKKLLGDHAEDRSIDIRFGFVKLASSARLALIDAVLCSPVGAYVREVALEGSGDQIAASLTTLGLQPRTWLSRLAIKQTDYSGDGNVPQYIADAVIAATPHLDELAVAGRRLFTRFAHPHVSKLELTGVDAIVALSTTGQGGMPAAVSLDFRFAFGNAPPTWDRRKVLLPSHFPCVTQLDLTRNAATASQSEFELFRWLRTLPIAPQLQRLCLPQIIDDDQLVNAQTALDRIPDLRELVVVACARASQLEHRRAKLDLR